VDPLRRIDYENILQLIRTRRYFVLHAPRQTGKTTSLLAMVKRLNDDGEFACVYVNVEVAQMARNDVSGALRSITERLARAIEQFTGDGEPLARANDNFTSAGANAALASMLSDYCAKLSKPLVLFIDEIDSLIGDSLVSVLRQLRSGYADRPARFPIAVILCGVRDIRDYRIHQSDGEIITGGSCFNVKAESLRLGDFTPEDIRELYIQHTAETGQIFTEDIYPKIWELTHGQPWLVNALAHEATSRMRENRDRTRPITLEIIERAAYNLILERTTHLDQLVDKLKESRVRKVIEPMLTSEDWESSEALKPAPDDIQYVIDLGLIRIEGKSPVISNAIYREVLPRELTWVTQLNMTQVDSLWYIAPDGSINIEKLLQAFQQFFRENIDSWKRGGDYEEAGFQLLLQAFLQRVINGGGHIEREYALGRRRVDLLIRRKFPMEAPCSEQQEQRIVVELKIITDKARATPERVLAEGLKQTWEYAQTANPESSHLMICDQREGLDWNEKIYDRIEIYHDLAIHVWGV
jgi:hypothetical protein